MKSNLISVILAGVFLGMAVTVGVTGGDPIVYWSSLIIANIHMGNI